MEIERQRFGDANRLLGRNKKNVLPLFIPLFLSPAIFLITAGFDETTFILQ